MILAHLDRQVESAAPAARDRDRAVRRDPQPGRRGRARQARPSCRARWSRATQLEHERDDLIQSAAARLGVPPTTVDLDAMLTLEPQSTASARAPLGRAQGPRHRDVARARPEPPARPAGALVPRPPDARALGHAAVRLLHDAAQRDARRSPTPSTPTHEHLDLLRPADRAPGILAQQRGLDVTAHNIANANTVGFTRQEAVMAASPAFSYPSVVNSGVPARSAPAST